MSYKAREVYLDIFKMHIKEGLHFSICLQGLKVT